MPKPDNLLSVATRGLPLPSDLGVGIHRVVLNSIDQGFCVIEVIFDASSLPADYVFLETNPAFSQQTGMTDVEGKRMRELAPSHEQHWFDIYGRVASTGEPTRFVQHAQALEERWFDVYAFRIDRPELHRVAILFTDITARIRRERNAALLSAISDELIQATNEREVTGAAGRKLAAFLNLSYCAFVELDFSRDVAVVTDGWHEPQVPAVVGTYALDDFLNPHFWRELRHGNTVVVGDTATDPRVTGLERFRELQIGSFAAVPLPRQNEWQYLFAVYRRHA